MFCLTLIAACALGAPGPVKSKEKDAWVGVNVYPKASRIEVYVLADGRFTISNTHLIFYDYFAQEEKDGYIRVNQDGTDLWLSKSSLVRNYDGVEHFTEVLDGHPNDTWSRGARVTIQMNRCDYERALKDAQWLVEKEPKTKEWLTMRACIYIFLKKYDEAITDCTTVLDRSDKSDYLAFFNRSIAYRRQLKFKEALGDLDASIAINKTFYWTHSFKAVVLATAPDAKLRDGKKALECAQEAKRLFKLEDGYICEAFACAYGELGEFDKALEYMKKALDDPSYVKVHEAEARKMLAAFRAKKPYHNE